MSILSHLRRSKKQKWDVITWPWGGWNYPEPILADNEWADSVYPPDDLYLHNLKYMADHGWHYYQKALVEMHLIHPLANFKPKIDEEFRRDFDAVHDDLGMPLLLYERDGKLIMGNDWKAYWLYREREDPCVPCIILGHFNEVPGVAVCDRPFMQEKPEYVLGSRQPLTTW